MAVSAGLGGRQVPWGDSCENLTWLQPGCPVGLKSSAVASFVQRDVGASAVPGRVSACLGLLAVPWCGGRDVLFCNAAMECGAPLEKENDSSEAAGVLLLFLVV